jgi:type VI protein secretion system component Hcp
MTHHPPGGGPIKTDLSVASNLGPQSPPFFLAAAQGTPFTDAILFMGRVEGGAAAKPRLERDMSNVSISSHQINGSGKDLPEEQFSLKLTKIKVTDFLSSKT